MSSSSSRKAKAPSSGSRLPQSTPNTSNSPEEATRAHPAPMKPVPEGSESQQTQTQGDKRPRTSHPTEPVITAKRPRRILSQADPPRPIGTVPRLTQLSVPDATIPATEFAPSYESVFLKANPRLVNLLRHVNCCYLTSHNGTERNRDGLANSAPSLAQLKQHAKSLIVLIKEMTVERRGGLVDNAGLLKDAGERQDSGDGHDTTADGNFTRAAAGQPTTSPLKDDFFKSLDAFDFLNDLSIPYVNNDPKNNEPLTHLLNQFDTRWDPSGSGVRVYDTCPLSAVIPISNGEEPAEFRPGVNPLPHSQINRLMKHADEILLLIDNALSSSGGLLSALPLDLPADDPKRNTFLGQMIHFMRVLVSKVHALDRDYGQTLDLLAGEACVPREIKMNLTDARQLTSAYEHNQHLYILNTNPTTYDGIWDHLRGDTRSFRDDGTGFLEVTLSTRYRALRGGKTIFITPVVEQPIASQVVGRPTVVACPKPGYTARVSEWERKNRGMLDEAKGWKSRAESAERQNEKLKADIDALEPEDVWHGNEKLKVTEMWEKVIAREDLHREKLNRVDVYAERIKKLEKANTELEVKLAKATRGRPVRAGPQTDEMNEDVRAGYEALREQLQREEASKLGPRQAGKNGQASQLAKQTREINELKKQVESYKKQSAQDTATPSRAPHTANRDQATIARLEKEVAKLKAEKETQKKAPKL